MHLSQRAGCVRPLLFYGTRVGFGRLNGTPGIQYGCGFDPSGGPPGGRKRELSMNRFVKALLCAAASCCALLAQAPPSSSPAPTAQAAPGDKAAIYYNFAMGRLY